MENNSLRIDKANKNQTSTARPTKPTLARGLHSSPAPALSQLLRLMRPEDELIEATRAGCVVQFVAIIIVLAASACVSVSEQFSSA